MITKIPARKKGKALLRVAAYARVSDESECESLVSQVQYYNTLIQGNPDWQFAGIFSDEGISGTTKRRPGFQAMLDACRAGKVDIVLTKSISRFARNTVDLLEAIRGLKEMGVGVRFDRERIDTLSSDGELMLTVLASYAQEESRSISENCKWGIRKRFEEGRHIGCAHILGYRWKNDKAVVIPEEARIVKDIFKWYLNGMEPNAIADRLNAHGLRGRRGGKFAGCYIREMLRNERFKGDVLLQKMYNGKIRRCKTMNGGELPQFYVSHAAPPIIDADTFDRVQRKLAGEKNYFRGKVHCACCGEMYVRKDGKYLACKSREKHRAEPCPGRYIRIDRLEEYCAGLLGLKEFDGEVFLRMVDHIEAYEDYLEFRMKDGTTIKEERRERFGKYKHGTHDYEDSRNVVEVHPYAG